MAQKKGLKRKDLKQPDTFQTKGEQVLQHFVENRKNYILLSIAVVAVVLGYIAVDALIQNSKDKTSLAFSKALEVYEAEVVSGKDSAKSGKLTFESENMKLVEAEKKFQAFIDEHGGSDYGTAARFYRANIMFRLKRYEKARAAYEEFLDKSGGDYDNFRFIAYFNVAQTFEEEKVFEKAIEQYKKILSLEKDAWKDQAMYMLARVYRNNGNEAEAVKQLEELVEKYPESPMKAKAEKLLIVIRGPQEEKAEIAEKAEGE